MASMSAAHAAVFRDAARHFRVFILVRQTNAASLDHIGKDYAVPKRLDCKAKTADCDVQTPYGIKQTAGLVTDPEIVGAQAYNGGKLSKAMVEWQRFSAAMIRPEVKTLEGQRALTYIPHGGFYFVDLDPQSPRYGCVKFTSSSLMSAGKYIHGDFDLYGIVPADDPTRNIRVGETMLGNSHYRSPEFRDVQIYVNRLLGVPMVLHGAQEAYDPDHSDEVVDIFHPDGQQTTTHSGAEMARLYQTLFRGRKLFTKGGAVDVVRGLFVTPN